MQRYIVKRVFQALVCLVLVSIVVAMLVHISGDPAVLLAPPDATREDIEVIRTTMGLDKPLYVQYWNFVKSAARGEFGISYKWRRPCIEVWAERIPYTLQLALVAFIFYVTIGLQTGLLAAVKVGSWFDNFGKGYAFAGMCLPSFWVGLMIMLLFGVQLRWLPACGAGSWQQILMPAFTLSLYYTATVVRLTRSSMLDVLDSEYIKMARIKGVPEIMVIVKHGFRNALIPVVTFGALTIIWMLGGSVVIERVFAYPGVGTLLIDSIFARDYPMVQTILFIFSSGFVFVNLFVDVLYAYVDPRIRYQ